MTTTRDPIPESIRLRILLLRERAARRQAQRAALAAEESLDRVADERIAAELGLAQGDQITEDLSTVVRAARAEAPVVAPRRKPGRKPKVQPPAPPLAEAAE